MTISRNENINILEVQFQNACVRLQDMTRGEIAEACVRNFNRGSLASPRTQRLPSEAERKRMRRWVRVQLQRFTLIAQAVAGQMDLTGFDSCCIRATRFDWEHAPPDWMNPEPPSDDEDSDGQSDAMTANANSTDHH